MGPRLFSRGNGIEDDSTSHVGLLQWGHDFSAVEMVLLLLFHPILQDRFNGATTFQPWKFNIIVMFTFWK